MHTDRESSTARGVVFALLCRFLPRYSHSKSILQNREPHTRIHGTHTVHPEPCVSRVKSQPAQTNLAFSNLQLGIKLCLCLIMANSDTSETPPPRRPRLPETARASRIINPKVNQPAAEIGPAETRLTRPAVTLAHHSRRRCEEEALLGRHRLLRHAHL